MSLKLAITLIAFAAFSSAANACVRYDFAPPEKFTGGVYTFHHSKCNKTKYVNIEYTEPNSSSPNRRHKTSLALVKGLSVNYFNLGTKGNSTTRSVISINYSDEPWY